MNIPRNWLGSVDDWTVVPEPELQVATFGRKRLVGSVVSQVPDPKFPLALFGPAQAA
jgi:hypothetical protein